MRTSDFIFRFNVVYLFFSFFVLLFTELMLLLCFWFGVFSNSMMNQNDIQGEYKNKTDKTRQDKTKTKTPNQTKPNEGDSLDEQVDLGLVALDVR